MDTALIYGSGTLALQLGSFQVGAPLVGAHKLTVHKSE